MFPIIIIIIVIVTRARDRRFVLLKNKITFPLFAVDEKSEINLFPTEIRIFFRPERTFVRISKFNGPFISLARPFNGTVYTFVLPS